MALSGSFTDTVMPAPVSNFQADTTNTAPAISPRMEIGWGVMTPGAASSATETVTFATAFNSKPIVLITYGGDNASAATYGSGGANIKAASATAHTITTTNFSARVATVDFTSWSGSNTVFYQWVAIGN